MLLLPAAKTKCPGVAVSLPTSVDSLTKFDEVRASRCVHMKTGEKRPPGTRTTSPVLREDIATNSPLASSTVADAGKQLEEDEDWGVESLLEVVFSAVDANAQSAEGQMTIAEVWVARVRAAATLRARMMDAEVGDDILEN